MAFVQFHDYPREFRLFHIFSLSLFLFFFFVSIVFQPYNVLERMCAHNKHERLKRYYYISAQALRLDSDFSRIVLTIFFCFAYVHTITRVMHISLFRYWCFFFFHTFSRFYNYSVKTCAPYEYFVVFPLHRLRVLYDYVIRINRCSCASAREVI